MNPEQKGIYEEILNSIYNNEGNKLFFIDAPGGTEKLSYVTHD